MTVVERRVRALRVRAPDGDRARRAAIVLEDALRTASLPGASSGRLVVIRSLDLGNVPLGASPATVSLVVEARLQRLASGAVHGDSSSAQSASAVYFRDDGEAILSLARRVAGGNAATSWFWPLVVRGWSLVLSPAQTMPLLLERAFASTAGVVTVAQLVEMLVEMEAIDLLLAPLSEDRGTELLAAIGWTIETDASTTASVMVRLAPQAERVVARWTARWKGGADDPRAKWLAAMLLVAELPSRATSSALVTTVRNVLASIEARDRETVRGTDASDRWERPRTHGARGETMHFAAKRWQTPPTRHIDSDIGGGPPQPKVRDELPPRSLIESSPPSFPDTAEPVLELTHDTPFEPPAHRPPFWDTPRPTPHAGLLFLVPLLSRVGIASILAERPKLVEHQWPERLLLRLARRLGVPPDDPMLAWLAPPDDVIAHTDRAITARWMRVTRDRGRRDTTRSLAAIVRRTGAIVATRTHVDVLLRYSQVDVAVRLAGLDIDPCWVSWLGRVIRFHYMDVLPDDTP